MHRSTRSFLMAAALVLLLATCSGAFIIIIINPYTGTYSGGTGTAEDPFVISNVADWRELLIADLDWGKYFILTADLDFAGATITPVGSDWSMPDRERLGDFSGVFDGRGHVVANAVINGSGHDYVGLFRELGHGALVCNLGVENVDVTGGSYTGGVCGDNAGGTIDNCYFTGAVRGGDDGVGGLCGRSSGVLNRSYSTASVNGGWSVGGLCGTNQGTMISQCYATGDVAGSSTVGGLCGENSYYTISQCYATGNVTGMTFLGGLCGSNVIGTIEQSYSTGTVTRTDLWYGGVFGGLCGFNGNTVAASFWNMQTSGLTTSAGGTGRSTAQMKTLSTFTSAGWDFVGETANGTDDIWSISAGRYPRLSFTAGCDTVSGLTCVPGNEQIHVAWTNPTEPNFSGVVVVRRCGYAPFGHPTAGASYAAGDALAGGTVVYAGSGTSFTDMSPGSRVACYYMVFAYDASTRYTRGVLGSRTVAYSPSGSSVFDIVRLDVKAGKSRGLDTIQFSGLMDANESEIIAAGSIVVTIDGDHLSTPKEFTFPIDAASFRSGKYSHRNRAGGVDETFKLNTATGRMSFVAKWLDLTGLSGPVAISITIGSYAVAFEADETIVNGPKKPCPLQLMMDVADTMIVGKVSVRRQSKDSLRVSGWFSTADGLNLSNPLVITMDGTTFTVPGSDFVISGMVAKCRKAASNEGPTVSATFDMGKCTFAIYVTEADISAPGAVSLGINCFGRALATQNVMLP